MDTVNADSPRSEQHHNLAHSAEDLFQLKDGSHDDALNKDIRELVIVTDTFAVYLATDLSVQWRTTDQHEWAADTGDVLNRVALLETRSRFINDEACLAGIRRQIAEGLARCFDEGKTDSATIILRETELEIQARNKEISWSWYFHAAYIVTFSCIGVIGLSWILRSWLRDLIGPVAFETLLGTMCGAIGALLSATARGDRIYLDANAGRKIHMLEGLSRIGAGMAGAAFVALSIQGGLILGGAQFAGSQFALLLAFCIAAGASERMVPDLVSKLENVHEAPGHKKAKVVVDVSSANVRTRKSRSRD